MVLRRAGRPAIVAAPSAGAEETTRRFRSSLHGPITVARGTGSIVGPVTAAVGVSVVGPVTAALVTSIIGAVTATTVSTIVGPVAATAVASIVRSVTATAVSAIVRSIIATTVASIIGPITAAVGAAIVGPVAAAVKTAAFARHAIVPTAVVLPAAALVFSRKRGTQTTTDTAKFIDREIDVFVSQQRGLNSLPTNRGIYDHRADHVGFVIRGFCQSRTVRPDNFRSPPKSLAVLDADPIRVDYVDSQATSHRPIIVFPVPAIGVYAARLRKILLFLAGAHDTSNRTRRRHQDR